LEAHEHRQSRSCCQLADVAVEIKAVEALNFQRDVSVQQFRNRGHQQLGLPIAGHKGGAGKVTVAFSPDDEMLVSGGCGRSSGAVCEQSEIRLWDVATRQGLGVPLIGHKGSITGLVFSTNGKTLASTGNDGTIIFWDISVESWVRRVCGIAHRNLTPGEWRQYLGDEKYRKTCPEL
jgi:WD40 repeat protein